MPLGLKDFTQPQTSIEKAELTKERELWATADKRIAELEEALSDAIDGWAAGLDMCPSIAGRKRLDAARAILGDKK